MVLENTLGLNPQFQVFTVEQAILEQEFRKIVKKNTGVEVGEALYIDMYESDAHDILVRLDDCADHLTDEDIDEISKVYNWDDNYRFSYDLLNEIFGTDKKPYMSLMYKDKETKKEMIAIQTEI